MRAVGAMNERQGDHAKVVGDIEFKRDDKVRLQLGKRRSDAVDMLMHNKLATIENIYTDYEDTVYIGVTIDDDPARDLKREMGLYLYFSPEEILHV